MLRLSAQHHQHHQQPQLVVIFYLLDRTPTTHVFDIPWNLLDASPQQLVGVENVLAIEGDVLGPDGKAVIRGGRQGGQTPVIEQALLIDGKGRHNIDIISVDSVRKHLHILRRS